MKPLGYEVFTQETEFKGNPVLEFKIGADSKYPFTLGVQKLKAVLLSVDKIKEFIESVEDRA